MNNPLPKTINIKSPDTVRCLSYLVDFKNRVEPMTAQHKQEFVATMEELWTFLTSIEDNRVVIEIQDDERFSAIQKSLFKKWHEYISLTETGVAEKFIAAKNLNENSNFSALSEEDYTSVNQELSLLNQTLTGLIVAMVGCGSFPETLMEIYKNNHSIKEAIGIEERSEVLKLASEVIAKVFPDAKNIKIRTSSAESLDYDDIDVIFLANGLINKETIMRKIYDTAKNDVKILARNPILMGKLLYEDLHTLPSIQSFVVCGSVRASKLSETILLKKRSGEDI